MPYNPEIEDFNRRVLRSLSDVPLRDPYDSELSYFKTNPHVSGMAAEDNAVILNPYSNLSASERQSVLLNERARVWMRNKGSPDFDLTPEQQVKFGSYGSPEDIRSTIAARVFAGDPSAGTVTDQQKQWVENNLRKYFIDDLIDINQINNPEEFNLLILKALEYNE